jgi:hypothetical protein
MNDLLLVTGAWYAKVSDVAYVVENSLLRTSRVIFNTGKDWVAAGFTPGTCVFGDIMVRGDNAGVYYQQKMSGLLPGKTMDYPNDELIAMIERPVIWKLELANGTTVIVGNTISPVRMEYELSSDNTEVMVSFGRKGVSMVYRLDETVESGSGA